MIVLLIGVAAAFAVAMLHYARLWDRDRATGRRYGLALAEIYHDEGHVCTSYTEGIDSTHGGCLSSQRAWDIADRALYPEGGRR